MRTVGQTQQILLGNNDMHQEARKELEGVQTFLEERLAFILERGNAKPDALKQQLNKKIDSAKDRIFDLLNAAKESNDPSKSKLRRAHRALIGIDNLVNDRLKATVKRQGRNKKRNRKV